MEELLYADALAQVRRMYVLLGETMDLSQQMAQAADRGDQVSLQMLMDMRAEPLQKLEKISKILKDQCRESALQGDGRLEALLSGRPSVSPEEEPLEKVVAQTRQLWLRNIDLDRRLNRKVAGENSYYQ